MRPTTASSRIAHPSGFANGEAGQFGRRMEIRMNRRKAVVAALTIALCALAILVTLVQWWRRGACAAVFVESDGTTLSSLPDSEESIIKNSTLYRVIDDLRVVDSAKQMWAHHNRQDAGAEPTDEELGALIKDGYPRPPIGGRYVSNPIDREPEFSISLTELQAYHKSEWFRIHQRPNQPSEATSR